MPGSGVADLVFQLGPVGGGSPVVGGGCSGMSYELGWDDAAADDDNVIEAGSVRVFVDTKSAPYLAGSEIDYVDNNMLGAGFAIKNPNVKSSCGCGSSHQF